MAWVESNQEIWQHPKTRKLARLLGASVPTAVGYLHGLWYWALSYAQDGIIGRYDAEEIADAVLWDGDPAAFIEALIASGYADETPDGTELHDWYEYTGRLMEQREIKKEQARVRKRRERERKKETSDDGLASVTRDCHDFTLLPTNQSTVQTDSTETLPTDNKIPDWVPLVGGKGFNIPQIPLLAKGTFDAPNTFIAGERGPELITGAQGSRVFPSDETGRIISALDRANQPIDVSDNPVQVSDDDSDSDGGAKTFNININGSGQISGKGMTENEVLEIMIVHLKPILMKIIKAEIYEEGNYSYEF